jgi:Ca2+-binding RTX toxin-like protein
MRIRTMFVSVATAGLMAAPAFASGIVGSAATARAECTIRGTAADDNINGTTRDDVICLKAGQDQADGLEGNDVIRGGQGDDGGGEPPHNNCVENGGRQPRQCEGPMHILNLDFGLQGGDGSDTIKGQADDDSAEGFDQNDRLFGGQGNDCLGANCTTGGISEPYAEHGDDFLKSRDRVSGNDYVDGGDNTDECVIDAGDENYNCEE